jgi:hypothetical protein
MLAGCGPAAEETGEGKDAGMDATPVQDPCTAKGLPPTTITGTVFAPNGTLPLYGISVYVPNGELQPLPEGVQCNRCDTPDAIVSTSTDEAGRFRLEYVPDGNDIPLVIASGKWRRKITIPSVPACQETQASSLETRLPKNRSQGDIPKIAITTGMADALECLVRKLGIDDSEFYTAGGAGRIHLYNGNGVNKFKTGCCGGAGAFASATSLWNSVDNLKKYDLVILSCEGGQDGSLDYPNPKSKMALDALKSYADQGGRVFASHWHNIWIAGANGDPTRPAVWPGIAQWDLEARPNLDPVTVTVDEVSNPKGTKFATWMRGVGAMKVEATNLGDTVLSLDMTKGERWLYGPGATKPPVNFQFTTPNDAAPAERCGKVAFSDMHVSADSTSSPTGTFPTDRFNITGCSDKPLTPQEKALAFMFFDLAACVEVVQ